jgi:AMP-binding enzyme C-terminal domain/Dioxygenase
MIVSGSENVFSAEVENALSKHPAILECAVIGVPDAKWGEAVHGVVRLRDGHSADAEELTRHCGDLIAGQPIGEQIIVHGHVLDGNGRPIRSTLVEVWQFTLTGKNSQREIHHGTTPATTQGTNTKKMVVPMTAAFLRIPRSVPRYSSTPHRERSGPRAVLAAGQPLPGYLITRQFQSRSGLCIRAMSRRNRAASMLWLSRWRRTPSASSALKLPLKSPSLQSNDSFADPLGLTNHAGAAAPGE